MNYFDDVAAFHNHMTLPVSAESTEPGYGSVRPPQIIELKEFNYRLAFLFEEIAELITGHSQGDLAKSADALVDIVWVALGTAHYFGIPFDALWREVQRANMEKRPWREGDPLKPRNVVGLEVVKPEGWRPPDIDGVLRNFRAKLDKVTLDGPCPPYDSLDEYSPGAQKSTEEMDEELRKREAERATKWDKPTTSRSPYGTDDE